MKRLRKRSLAKRVFFSAIAVFICLLLLEVLMIVLEPYLSTGLCVYDPDLGFRVRPGANGTNRFGFLDRDYPLEKDPGTFRIIVVGDSFNWSGGLKHNYISLLEDRFDRHYGEHKVDVINTGYPMTHTVEQLAMMRKFALQYNPDLVVLGFFVGNDFLDADPHRKRIVVNDTYFDIDRYQEKTFLGYPMIFKSRLLYFVKQKFIELKERLTVGAEKRNEKLDNRSNSNAKRTTQTTSISPSRIVKRPEEIAVEKILANLGSNGDSLPTKRLKNATAGRLSNEFFLSTEKSRMEFCRRSDQQAGKYDDRIAYILDGIKDMDALLKSRNMQFIVGIYPDSFQVDDEVLKRTLDASGTDLESVNEAYDLLMMQRILIAFLEENGIPYIDLTDSFRAVSRHAELYGTNDSHWNIYGNQLAAQRLFPRLLKIVEARIGPPGSRVN